MRVKDVLIDMIRYGDIHEAPILEEDIQTYNEAITNADMETQIRLEIIACFENLVTKEYPMGNITSHDDVLRDILSREIEGLDLENMEI